MKLLALCIAILMLTGCATHGVIVNAPKGSTDAEDAYSIATVVNRKGSEEIVLLLAFSGGGTRAAALSYGVLEELRDTTIHVAGRSIRVLDEVDMISSVSGGSFTAAYYGVNGEAIFEDFEDVFLRRDVQSGLIQSVLNPFNWFSDTARTDIAVSLYEDIVFQGATFADMKRAGGPLILLNASGLGHGLRFSFVQEYFNLLCSDISSFSVARAVAASSSVPVVFNPVVMKNYLNCETKTPDWLEKAEQHSERNQELIMTFEVLKRYFNDTSIEYLHLVDGGITDNLGLRAIYEIVEIVGGIEAFIDLYRRKPPRSLVIISVDAATEPALKMDSSQDPPSIDETINAMSSSQLHRYNAATMNSIDESMESWASQLSTPSQPVNPYFIKIKIGDIKQKEVFESLNSIPTSFSLNDQEVDLLIKSGHELLLENHDFQRLLKDLKGH